MASASTSMRGERRPLQVRDWPAAWTWASAAVLLLFVAGRCLQPMDETDLFYNLRLGEIVLGTHHVPRNNLLSFTNPDAADPNLAWLFQIVLALAYRAGGVAGTVLLKTTFVVTTFALLFRVAVRRGAHPVVAALALALAAWAAEPRFVERPHLVTFLGLATLLLALERAERGRPTLLLALIPGGLVWANGNSCFFLARVLLALYALGCLADRRTADGKRAVLVALALLPLTLATPSGTDAWRYIANHFRMPSLRPLQEYRVAEWPTDGPFFFLALAVALGAALSLVRAARAGEPRTLRQVLPLVALGVLGARRIRFVAEFALLAGPYVAARLSATLTRSAPGTTARPQLAVRASAVCALTALVALTLAPRFASARAGRKPIDLGMEPDLVPLAAIAWLDAAGLRDHLYNDLEVGSYLAWEGWPRHRVFQDPRINGYPDRWHAFLRRDDHTRAEWDAFLARYDVQAALISYPDVNPRTALFDPARWALVFRSSEALVFVRRGPAHDDLIAREEQPLTFHFERATGAEPVPIDEPPATSPLAACEWQRRLGEALIERRQTAAADAAFGSALRSPGCLSEPTRAAARQQAASVALELGDAARARSLLQGLDTPSAQTNRGYAELQLGRPEEALAAFERARALDAGTSGAASADLPQATFGAALALVALHRRDEARAALMTFLARWPEHFAVPRTRELLRTLSP
jgi:tetratricopeptide (TPR) repeat protein